MREYKTNIRERAGNYLMSVMLLSSSVVDGNKPKLKLAEISVKDLDEILRWLTKSGEKGHATAVRKKAIEKIKEMRNFCTDIIENKDVTAQMAANTLSSIEEIRNWLDKREYKTKSSS